jgi:hypothetical protein
MAAYNQFSRSMHAKITIEEFMFGLDRLDIILNPKNVELFYRRYDSD